MSDPFEVENKFQQLKQTLILTSGKRLKLLHILNFIDPLITARKLNILAAYIDELLPYFSTIYNIDFTGTNISFLLRINNDLKILYDYFPVFSESKNIKNSIVHLGSEIEKIKHWMVNRKEELAFGFTSAFKQKQINSTAIDSVWIPFVEKERLFSESKSHFAIITKLKVDVNFSNKKGEDEFLISGYFDTGQQKHKEVEISLSAAKNLFMKLTGVEITERLLVYCNFDDAYIFVGESLEAGLTAVIFCELLRLSQYKEEFLLRDKVAITGKIDETGNLYPVDEVGLRLKVEACNFSFIRQLIVPKEQEELCKKYIAEIEKVDDSPYVEIIGINRIKEIFTNRKFTDLHHVPLIKRSARKVWNVRRKVVLITFFIMALIIGKMYYGPIDKNPVDFKYEGKNLVLINQFGETVDKIKLMKESNDSSTVSFYDIDKDGNNEILWTDNQGNMTGSGEIIKCKNIILNKILWTYNPFHKLNFPNNYAGEGGFNCTRILTDDFENNGKPVVIAAFINGYFPTLICKINAVTGKEISCYINTGHIHLMNKADLDKDGIKEILLCGVSNAFDCTCFIILDSRFISGHSPLTDKYLVDNVETGKEKYYLLFPKTIIGETLKSGIRNYPTGIEVDNITKTIRLSVSEAVLSGRDMVIFPNIGFDLKIKNVGTGDYYDKTADSLYDAGKINIMPTPKYFKQAYSKKIEYWNGYKFVNKWALNIWYLEALKTTGKINLPKNFF